MMRLDGGGSKMSNYDQDGFSDSEIENLDKEENDITDELK